MHTQSIIEYAIEAEKKLDWRRAAFAWQQALERHRIGCGHDWEMLRSKSRNSWDKVFRDDVNLIWDAAIEWNIRFEKNKAELIALRAAKQTSKQANARKTATKPTNKSFCIYTENTNRDGIKVILNKYFDAYNITDTEGVWRGTSENSLAIMLIDVDPVSVSKVVEEIAAVNRQEAVLLMETEGHKTLFFQKGNVHTVGGVPLTD